MVPATSGLADDVPEYVTKLPNVVLATTLVYAAAKSTLGPRLDPPARPDHWSRPATPITPGVDAG